MVSDSGFSGDLSLYIANTATDTAFAECVEGNPYSKDTCPDIVILCSGGDSGRGSESISFNTDVRKTPAERICTILRPSIPFP